MARIFDNMTLFLLFLFKVNAATKQASKCAFPDTLEGVSEL